MDLETTTAEGVESSVNAAEAIEPTKATPEPREAVVDAPGPRLDTAADVLRELGRVYRAARAGRIKVTTGYKLALILSVANKAIETQVLEARIAQLERENCRLIPGSTVQDVDG